LQLALETTEIDFAAMTAKLRLPEAQQAETVAINATHLKTHRTASSLAVKKGPNDKRRRLIGRSKGGLNSKLHVFADARGRPIRMFLSAGQTSDHIGARAPAVLFSAGGALLADRGQNANWFRNSLIEMGICPCIPSRVDRKVQIPHDADLYHQRHRIENMFAHIKDWRRIATRCDRCPILFLSACALAAADIKPSAGKAPWPLNARPLNMRT